jgi:hypothetical protein
VVREKRVLTPVPVPTGGVGILSGGGAAHR